MNQCYHDICLLEQFFGSLSGLSNGDTLPSPCGGKFDMTTFVAERNPSGLDTKPIGPYLDMFHPVEVAPSSCALLSFPWACTTLIFAPENKRFPFLNANIDKPAPRDDRKSQTYCAHARLLSALTVRQDMAKDIQR